VIPSLIWSLALSFLSFLQELGESVAFCQWKKKKKEEGGAQESVNPLNL
jgi:hypothetical protein